MEFAKLYTLASTGSVRYWSIKVIQEGEAVFTIRDYGAVDGKAIINRKQILEAKSKKTVYEQAVFEARKEWNDKQNKNGYTTDLASLASTASQLKAPAPTPAPAPAAPAPSANRVGVMPEPDGDEPFQVGVIMELTGSEPIAVRSFHIKFLPMLANKFLERKKYVTYPCIAQPKIDGVRYSARKVGDVVELHTRKDEISPFFLEIKEAIKLLNPSPDVFLDGEFCSTSIPFRTLNGYCNRKTTGGKSGYDAIPPEDLASIHYHLFDCYFIREPLMPFVERYAYLAELMAKNSNPLLELVPNVEIAAEEEVQAAHEKFVAQGFEGAIIRNIAGIYKLKDRSNDLLKLKAFQDSEFEIAGATAPTNGKEKGCIIWILRAPGAQKTFTCRPEGSYEERQAAWQEYQAGPQQFNGKLYTVKYQETYENGVPRFPCGLGIRYDTTE